MRRVRKNVSRFGESARIAVRRILLKRRTKSYVRLTLRLTPLDEFGAADENVVSFIN